MGRKDSENVGYSYPLRNGKGLGSTAEGTREGDTSVFAAPSEHKEWHRSQDSSGSPRWSSGHRGENTTRGDWEVSGQMGPGSAWCFFFCSVCSCSGTKKTEGQIWNSCYMSMCVCRGAVGEGKANSNVWSCSTCGRVEELHFLAVDPELLVLLFASA